MGQKVNPIGFRLGILKYWDSVWYADKKKYKEQLIEDFKIRNYITKKLQHAAVSKVEIRRESAERIKVVIHTARPGLVIGRKGTEIDKLTDEVFMLVNKNSKQEKKVDISIQEIKNPDLDANLVAQKIAAQFLRRIAFRRVMKQAAAKTMREGAEGVKIQVAGRLGGAEMARTEWIRLGRVPLQTIRADIDYGFAEAKTKYGVIGIKVWIYKGEVLEYEKFAF